MATPSTAANVDKAKDKDVEAGGVPESLEVEEGGRRSSSSSSRGGGGGGGGLKQTRKPGDGLEVDDEVKGSALAPDGKLAPAVVAAQRRGLQPPEFLRHVSAEERAVMERHLVRKIDLRLMPCVIVMYILNYLDRYVRTSPSPREDYGRRIRRGRRGCMKTERAETEREVLADRKEHSSRTETTSPPPAWPASRRTCTSSATSSSWPSASFSSRTC